MPYNIFPRPYIIYIYIHTHMYRGPTVLELQGVLEKISLGAQAELEALHAAHAGGGLASFDTAAL